MTTTTATEVTIEWTADAARDALPVSVWRLDDGRILAEYADDRRSFSADLNELGQVHPHHGARQDASGATRVISVPSVRETIAVEVDWAAIHHAAADVDRARRLGNPDYPLGSGECNADAYGGTYVPARCPGLADLVSILRGTEIIASEAWGVVHSAHRARDRRSATARARSACQVAVACSRLFGLLACAGLTSEPTSRICGTGSGYGLTGLRWLAGAASDSGCTTAEVDAFIATGELPC